MSNSATEQTAAQPSIYENPPAPAVAAPAVAAPAEAASPPAAAVVIAGERTEREISLEEALATERALHVATASEKKAREVRIAELEDELHRLKGVGVVAPAAPKVKRLAPGTFFEIED